MFDSSSELFLYTDKIISNKISTDLVKITHSLIYWGHGSNRIVAFRSTSTSCIPRITVCIRKPISLWIDELRLVATMCNTNKV